MAASVEGNRRKYTYGQIPVKWLFSPLFAAWFAETTDIKVWVSSFAILESPRYRPLARLFERPLALLRCRRSI